MHAVTVTVEANGLTMAEYMAGGVVRSAGFEPMDFFLDGTEGYTACKALALPDSESDDVWTMAVVCR